MNIAQAKSILLADLLDRLGYQVAYKKKEGKEYWYKSPLRKEDQASFHVDVNRNIWFDFGLGEGGNILDFVMYHEKTDLSGALKFLDHFWGGQVLPISQKKVSLNGKIHNPTSNLSFIRSKKEFSQASKAYLRSRHITPRYVQYFLKEVIFKIRDKEQFALGMKNNTNGWELRSSIFKGCISPKDITLFQSNIESIPYLSIFEGMFDFLSLICWQYPNPIKGTVIILHSTSNIKKLAPYLGEDSPYQKIYTFLDNDRAGEQAFSQLQEMTNIPLFPKNSIYNPYKDISEWWMKTVLKK